MDNNTRPIIFEMHDAEDLNKLKAKLLDSQLNAQDSQNNHTTTSIPEKGIEITGLDALADAFKEVPPARATIEPRYTPDEFGAPLGK
jgi:hypothetical protein